MKKALRILQRDGSDCGPACLAAICAYYKLFIPVSRIRMYSGTDKTGTNVLGLAEAATKLGLQAKGVKAAPETIGYAPLPCIAHMRLNEEASHFVVLYKIRKEVVFVMDPAEGRSIKIYRKDFMNNWTGVLLLITPGVNFQVGNEKRGNMARFWQLAGPQRKTLIYAMAGAMLYSLMGMSMAIYVQKIVDLVLSDIHTGILNLLSVTMIVLIGVQFLIAIIKTMLAIEVAQHIDARLMLGYYERLLHLPQRFFDTMRIGELTSRLNDAAKIRTLISDVSVNLLINVLILVFSFMLMFFYYWKLALLLIVILPLYIIIYFLSDRVNIKWQKRIMENSAALESQLVGSLHAVSTIKKLGLERDANEKTESRFFTLLNTFYRESVYQVYIIATAEFMTRVYTVVILWIGSYYVINRKLSTGELLSFYALISYFTNPVIYLLNANKQTREALIAADRLFEIMDLDPETDGGPKIGTPQDLHGEILFSHVGFRYGYGSIVFNDLNFRLPKGSVTGFVGESGSGKSTIAALMQNLYPLTSGSISYNNIDVKYINPFCLRKAVGVASQHTHLFPGTIIDNIAIGDAEPDLKKILDITGRLGILDFISGMPDGLYTHIEEQGSNLSGGQQQRIAIARAFYRCPFMLVLDEATAALDALSEQKVLETIKWFTRQGNSVVIIAHRLSMLVDCDVINVLHNGKIVEQGANRELMLSGGLYQKMFSVNNNGLLEK